MILKIAFFSRKEHNGLGIMPDTGVQNALNATLNGNKYRELCVGKSDTQSDRDLMNMATYAHRYHVNFAVQKKLLALEN